MYKAFIAIGIPINIVEIGVIAWWVATGNWRPLAITLPFIIVACILLVCAYRKRTAYVCGIRQVQWRTLRLVAEISQMQTAVVGRHHAAIRRVERRAKRRRYPLQP